MDLPPFLGSDGPSWSKLPLDILHLVFERLGFADFQRVKSVCPSWKSTSTQSAPKNQIPWLIMFSEKGKDYCLLLNPEENEKIYKIQDLGANFAESHCLAIYGSWLFMRDPQYNFYIMNLFTREKIDLPSMESQLGMLKIERRTIDDMCLIKINGVEFQGDKIYIELPLLWIDEKTKEYVVIWRTHYIKTLFYSRNGDTFWKQFDNRSVEMVYKDHRLYSYSIYRDVEIFDFSVDIPEKISETLVNYNIFAKGIPRRIYPELGDVWNIKETNLVVTVSREIMRVESTRRSDSDFWSFRIYTLDSSNSEWKTITSLGDEAILLDQCITVLANANKGVNRNSIYFSGIHDFGYQDDRRGKDIFIFNLDTQMVERPHQSICSSVQSSDVRWFVPNFTCK